MTDYSPLPEAMRTAKPATDHTRTAQQRTRDELDWSDTRSFADARRGFIATLEAPTIAHARGGRPALDLTDLDFLAEAAPDTVNPSLWRQAQLNAQHSGAD